VGTTDARSAVRDVDVAFVRVERTLLSVAFDVDLDFDFDSKRPDERRVGDSAHCPMPKPETPSIEIHDPMQHRGRAALQRRVKHPE
jgi:hypothetical protein